MALGNASETVKRLEKQAVWAIDTSRKGGNVTVRVKANDLLTLCHAYDQASEGNYADQEYALKVLQEDKRKLQEQLEKIAELVDVDSKIWSLAQDHGVF